MPRSRKCGRQHIFERTLTILREAIPLAEGLGDWQRLGQLHCFMSMYRSWGQAIEEPLSRVVAPYAAGLLHLRQGAAAQVIALWEQSLALCREWHVQLLLSWVASALGTAYVHMHRLTRGVSPFGRGSGMLQGHAVGAVACGVAVEPWRSPSQSGIPGNGTRTSHQIAIGEPIQRPLAVIDADI